MTSLRGSQQHAPERGRGEQRRHRRIESEEMETEGLRKKKVQGGAMGGYVQMEGNVGKAGE